jgi:type III secretion protein U
VADQPTEQKEFAASARKLRKAREEGNVATSADLTSSVHFVVMLALIVLFSITAVDYLAALHTLALIRLTPSGLADWPGDVILVSAQILTGVIGLMAIASLASIIVGFLYTKGIVFAIKLAVPKMERVNPVEGTKRIFGKQGAARAGQYLFRLIVIVLAGGAIFAVYYANMVRSYYCAEECTAPLTGEIMILYLILAIIIALIAAVMDSLIQNFIFMEDMKMTRSEQKRDSKESFGSPEVRRERQRIWRDELQAARGQRATAWTVLLAGDDVVVALSYDAEEIPVPQVGAKADGQRAEALTREAQGRGLPVFVDRELTADIFRSVNIGSPIPPRLYQRVADILVEF